MPHYRITIKLENENVKEYIIEDDRKAIDFVYLDYRKRVFNKNVAGRVVYFDLVMLADESLKHQEGRKEVFNEMNNFGLTHFAITKKKAARSANFQSTMTLAERTKYNSKLE